MIKLFEVGDPSTNSYKLNTHCNQNIKFEFDILIVVCLQLQIYLQ